MSDAKLDRKSGLWTVFLEGSERTFTGRVLVCADGAPSKLAGQLGIVMQPPQGICSRSYVEAGTHRFQADGVVFYTQDMMPGTPQPSFSLLISPSIFTNCVDPIQGLTLSSHCRLCSYVPPPKQ